MSGQDGYFPPDDDASAGSAAAGAAATAARHSASPGSSETTADRIDRQVRLRHEMMVRVGLMPPPIGAIAAAAAAPRPVSPVSVHLQEPRNFELEEPGPLDNGDDDEVDREGDLFHLRRREDPYHGERAPASHASRTLSDGSNHLARPTARMGLSWPQPPQPVPLAERGVILPEQLFRDEPRFQDPPHPDDAVAQLNDLSLDDDDLDLEDDLTDDLEEDPESEAASATGYMARNSVPRNQRNHSRPRNTSGSGSMADSGGGGGLDEFACSDEDSALPVNKRRSRNLVTAANGVPSNLMGPAMQNGIPAYNWQATKKTIKERMAFMFNSEILADVHFVVGREANQQRIPGHRFVLSIGSAVFDAMFNSTLATKDEEITIPDVEPTAFLVLLRFIYCDEVQIGPETVMTTLYTAKKYAVPSLEKHCVDFLKHNLSADNAFMLLTQARLFDEPQLALLCLESIDKQTPEALNAEGFVDIDVETLSMVLDRDSLRVKESILFASLVKWGEAECLRQNLAVTPENKRSVLGSMLTKIRFPLMTVEEFAQGPAQSGILSDKETVSLFLHFTVNPKPPTAFPDAPRSSMTGKEQTVCRFKQIESRWGYSGTSDKIRFIVDRRIFVVGFGLYGAIHGPSEYSANIQLLHTGTGRLMATNDMNFLSDGTDGTFRLMFKEPVECAANTNFTASATLKGLDSHYGTKGLRKVWTECPAGGRVTFQFSYAAGNNNGTSVEDGQIPEIIFYV